MHSAINGNTLSNPSSREYGDRTPGWLKQESLVFITDRKEMPLNISASVDSFLIWTGIPKAI